MEILFGSTLWYWSDWTNEHKWYTYPISVFYRDIGTQKEPGNLAGKAPTYLSRSRSHIRTLLEAGIFRVVQERKQEIVEVLPF